AEVVELGVPLLRAGGALLAWKRAAGLHAEMRSAGGVLRAVGGAQPRIEPADPSGSLGLADHRLVVVRKARPTPARYPRPPAERKRALLG
ncbi:MAG TPA: 16S rRNA (guanine(527)-N(7))-methyltransferase RsmG, partial [Candidatus Limnocylindria bacterium]|nr:16S rRNA (guanine(527)-N(7))-methyltransferase RsmG [Candidatus Limnocylindria bacterium]